MTYCPMCGHACYRTPERPDWSCPYHGRVNLLQAKMEKHTMETGVDHLKELKDLQAICRQFLEGIDKLGIS